MADDDALTGIGEKATGPDSVVFQFRISILSAGASMEIRRDGHAFRVPISSSTEY